ncbi:sulfite exporter TauE/SafE family protein [Candidatus Nomurabacteria bacterium]|nr:sulfite exporter TauE/SafE family protein [Candidatus Kaiserbacteria bacterium]MCB9814036.1 sulfite exporter TauE/SafE family protein [Candidatus Nomurabacteria bacterium]
MKKITLHVSGMHCPSCPMLIEGELTDLQNITEAKASLKLNQVEITGEFGDKTEEEIADSLSEVVTKHGYKLSVEKQNHSAAWGEFWKAVPIALAFIGFFVLLQKLGIVNLITSSDVTYGSAFLIGLVASVSSCMAVVGGLVLSVSANFAKEGDKVRPQILFHVGRLVSFFVLGGVIGALGSAFQLSVTGTMILGILVGLILVILGVNLLDVFPWVKKLQPALPSFIGNHVQGLKLLNHTLTPMLLGLATFFLPCGFTQAMQIQALSSENFMTGALIMFSFALGTLPVLAILSFSSLGVHSKVKSSIFFKTAGLVVIFFGLLNLMNSLVAAGIISPVFSL